MIDRTILADGAHLMPQWGLCLEAIQTLSTAPIFPADPAGEKYDHQAVFEFGVAKKPTSR